MSTTSKIIAIIVVSSVIFNLSAQQPYRDTTLSYVNILAQSGRHGMSEVYEGIDNRLKIIVEGKTFNELDVYYNGVKLKKENGFFLLNPKKDTIFDDGRAIVFNGQPVTSGYCSVYAEGIEKPIFFRLDTIPEPLITIYPYEHHYYSSYRGILELYVIPPSSSIGTSYSYPKLLYEVKSYKLTIIKNNKTLYSKVVIGYKIDDEANRISKTLCNGDKLILDSVDVRLNDLRYILGRELVIYNSMNNMEKLCD